MPVVVICKVKVQNALSLGTETVTRSKLMQYIDARLILP